MATAAPEAQPKYRNTPLTYVMGRYYGHRDDWNTLVGRSDFTDDLKQIEKIEEALRGEISQREVEIESFNEALGELAVIRELYEQASLALSGKDDSDG